MHAYTVHIASASTVWSVFFCKSPRFMIFTTCLRHATRYDLRAKTFKVLRIAFKLNLNLSSGNAATDSMCDMSNMTSE